MCSEHLLVKECIVCEFRHRHVVQTITKVHIGVRDVKHIYTFICSQTTNKRCVCIVFL